MESKHPNVFICKNTNDFRIEFHLVENLENLPLLMRRVAAGWSLLVKSNLVERMKAELEVYDDQSSGAFPGWQVVM